ncbi:MAG: metal transporter [Ignavibacteriales bacterium CG_4_9_14_3_um_filter_34_10]|nr:MAG: metal transporter [Ignavibacteriales bacterium CG_4_9_14_3_um_filter_34_10]
MEIEWLHSFLILFLCLLLSGLFSGSEVALFSLDKKKLISSNKNKSLLIDYILQLMETPKRLLVTILIGNTIVNVAAAIISVNIALQLAPIIGISKSTAILIQILITTILILIFSEVTPKIIASKNPIDFAKYTVIPIYWISVIIYPVSKIITDLLKLFSSKINFSKSKSAIMYNELSNLAEIGAEKGTLEEGEHEIINGLVNFRTVLARESMTPRVDIVAIPSDADYSQVLKIITEAGYSRYPLFQENLDDIIGIIYAKDLLPFLSDDNLQKTLSLKNLARKALFIPETKKINELLHLFQESKLHIGIVVDEYGGTSGLISLEDVLEEIVGEIRDEYDQEENELIKIDDHKYVVLGKMKIDELNELFEADFSSENDEYDTVGGFIFSHSGNIPKDGYSFVKNGCKFIVKDVINKRINKVLVEKLENDSAEESGKKQ